MAPYVRVHGNQVAIVHGSRDKGSGKVVQQTLFTLYSKKEATAATGDHENAEHERYFRQLLENAHPHLKFDWDDLKTQIRDKMEALPDIYPLHQERSTNTLRNAMDEFVKQLVLTDPAFSPAGRKSLDQLADELSLVTALLDARLAFVGRQSTPNSPFDHHDPFCWRNELQGNEVPSDIDELSAEMYQSGQYEEAKTLLTVLVRCFPAYAEGFNRLGLIALAQRNPLEAAEFFRTTIKVARNRFPRRLASSEYWLDIDTRPYIRGLMNLALALNQAERYQEALEVCDQLYKECGSTGQVAATAHRAVAYLNLNLWQKAFEEASGLVDHSPDEGFIAGYALFEMGKKKEAIELFLYAAAHSPHSAYLLLDSPKAKPRNDFEVEDYNSGVEMCRSMLRYFDQQTPASKKFFKRLRDHQSVKALLADVIQCGRVHMTASGDAHHQNFSKWTQLKSRKHAKALAAEIMAVSGT